MNHLICGPLTTSIVFSHLTCSRLLSAMKIRPEPAIFSQLLMSFKATITTRLLRTEIENSCASTCSVRPIGDTARAAFEQVMHYFRQNQHEMRRVIQTEVDVSLEKDGYILSGRWTSCLAATANWNCSTSRHAAAKEQPRTDRRHERQLCVRAYLRAPPRMAR